MKKIFASLLAGAAVLSLAACGANAATGTTTNTTTTGGNTTTTSTATTTTETRTKVFTPVSKANIKVGLITLHDETSTYDKNFIDSMKRAVSELGLSESQLLVRSGIDEDNSCYEAASQLALTCNVVFADSFGHEDFLIDAAEEHEDVLFAHATGTKAHTENLTNFGNAFASIYEGRYLAGIAAGMKLNEMIQAGQFQASEAKMGYVGAFPYAEVISGYTSFYLGAKSVCPSVTMEVQFTNSWFNIELEGQAANNLIQRGAKLISQHADSMGAPNACETAGVPNVTYNGSTAAHCPNTYIVSSKIDWTPYFKYLIQSRIDGYSVEKDWTGNLSNGAVALDAVGSHAATGTQAAIDAAKAQLIAGTLNVFDTSKFTVSTRGNGTTTFFNLNATVDSSNRVTGYLADVNSDPDYTGDTQVVANGVFKESVFRSAPYFDLHIDGITTLN